MIRFIELASRAVNISKPDSHSIPDLINDTADFYRDCPSIYKPKAFFLASYINAKLSVSIALDPSPYSQASLVDVYGLGGAQA